MAEPASEHKTAGRAALRGRDRTHQHPARSHRLHARFAPSEYGEIVAAAAASGMTPTGWVAETALAAARGTTSPLLDPHRGGMAQLQAELFALRSALGRIAEDLARLTATPGPTAGMPTRPDAVLVACEQQLLAVDVTIGHIDRVLR